MKVNKVSAEEMVEKVEIEKGVAEKLLALARPALMEAEAALNTISSSNISTTSILSFLHPCCACICVFCLLALTVVL